jgi:hypothetical protein
MKENPGAHLCSGFFTMDKEGKDNKRHFDFYVPKTKKMFSFKLEDGVEMMPIDIVIDKIPDKLDIDFDFEFEEIEKMLEGEMKKKEIKSKIQKIILSLQDLKGKPFLVGTIFISMLGLLKVQIDISDMKIVEFEKKSFFDMMKRLK